MRPPNLLSGVRAHVGPMLVWGNDSTRRAEQEIGKHAAMVGTRGSILWMAMFPEGIRQWPFPRLRPLRSPDAVRLDLEEVDGT